VKTCNALTVTINWATATDGYAVTLTPQWRVVLGNLPGSAREWRVSDDAAQAPPRQLRAPCRDLYRRILSCIRACVCADELADTLV
jgi:hypothetical protein